MSVQSGSTYGLRSIIDLSQPYTSFKPFSLTTSSEDAETVLTVSDYMEEAHRITLVVDKNDLYVKYFMTKVNNQLEYISKKDIRLFENEVLYLIEGLK